MLYYQPTKEKQLVQNNRSNIFPLGNLWSTVNMDYQSNLGVSRVSPRLKLNTGSLNSCPVAFVRFGQRIFALAGTTIYRNTNASGLPNDAFVADNSTSASTDYSSNTSDMIGAWNRLFATAPTKVRTLSGPDGGAWSDVATITTGINHKLVYFKKFDRVYFANQSIGSFNEALTVVTTGDYTLGGTNTFGVVDMRATSDWIWIAGKTEDVKDQVGEIWKWDGISAQVNGKFNLPGARAVVKLIIDPTRDTPIAMSDKGVLYEWNGGGFSELENGRLPYGKKNLPYAGASPTNTQNNDRFIHPNGGYYSSWNTIRVLINGVNMDNGVTQNENLASGIWEWDRRTGFSHIGSPSYDPIADSITDFAQTRVSRVGALEDMNTPSAAAGRDGTLLAGVTYYTDATTADNGIFYDNSIDTIIKKGYFVTTWIESSQVASSWTDLWLSFRKFLSPSTDNIVFKYRTNEEAPVEGTITWVDTTHFTVANSAVVVSNFWTAGSTGGEVEILRGTGGGLCAHIIDAVLVAGTWTVTIDEVATGATTGTATARFQKWIKLYPREPFNTVTNWTSMTMSTESTPRVQIKGCFTFTGVGEFYKAIINSNEDITIK